MKRIKEIITDDLMREVGRVGNLIDQISGIDTPAELAEIASNGSLGCPSYYGLDHAGCKNHTPAMCRRCWLKALNKEFDAAGK